MNDVIVKAADEAGRRQGAALFARAMGRPDPGVVAWLYRFSNLLAEGRIGYFITAHHKDRIVGYGALFAYVKVGWIGFMATEPELQGRGIGGAVMKGLMQLAADIGIKTLKLDATDIGVRLYSKFGFEEEYHVRRFEIPAQCGPSGAKTSKVRLAERLPRWCLEMDRRAFGDSRRMLLQLALRDGGKALLAEPHGFGILSGKRLGPVVAETSEAAAEIVQRAGSLGANAVYVPLHTAMPEGFLAILKEPQPEGAITCCTRMRLGDPIREDVAKVFASYSAATG